MIQKINLRISLLILMIMLAAFSRIIPHMPNFSPLGAIGLFGAAYFAQRCQAFMIPITATRLSDLFINNVIYAKYYPGAIFQISSAIFIWRIGAERI